MEAVIYTRNSSGAVRSVEEQEAEARQVCDREGWTVRHVVTDLVGASRHSKGKRTGWAEVKRLVAVGDVDVLVTWECSRAQRDLEAYVELRALCASAGVLWSYSGRTHDLSKGEDRWRTGLDALLAERETEETVERIQRAMRANALAGRPHGRRLYGYQRVYDPATGSLTGQVPHPIEAPVVRGIFVDYLAGIPLRTIAGRLTGEGVLTTKGTPWRDAQVRNLLQRPAYAGLRVHRGEVVGEATWEPLVPLETFRKVEARMEAQRARQVRFRGQARLLSGVARCGVCGSKVAVGHDRHKRKVYMCRGGFHVARDEAMLDAWASGQIVRRLEGGSGLRDGRSPAVAAAEAEVAVLRARYDEAVAGFTSGQLSAMTLARVEGELLPAITTAEAALRRAVMPLELEGPADGEYRRWWDEVLTADQRRAVATAMIAVLVIRNTVRGRRTFDPDAVSIEWAT